MSDAHGPDKAFSRRGRSPAYGGPRAALLVQISIPGASRCAFPTARAKACCLDRSARTHLLATDEPSLRVAAHSQSSDKPTGTSGLGQCPRTSVAFDLHNCKILHRFGARGAAQMHDFSGPA